MKLSILLYLLQNFWMDFKLQTLGPWDSLPLWFWFWQHGLTLNINLFMLTGHASCCGFFVLYLYGSKALEFWGSLWNKNFADVLLGHGPRWNRQLTENCSAWDSYQHLSCLYSGNVAESDIVDFVSRKTNQRECYCEITLSWFCIRND